MLNKSGKTGDTLMWIFWTNLVLFCLQFFLLLVSFNVNIQEAKKRKLCQREKYEDRADDDEYIEGSSVGDLGLGLPAKPDGDHGQGARGAETCPGGNLLTLK